LRISPNHFEISGSGRLLCTFLLYQGQTAPFATWGRLLPAERRLQDYVRIADHSSGTRRYTLLIDDAFVIGSVAV
jgi:hypothetical protein